MEKLYKATARALGGKPNGTGLTSVFLDSQLIKQLVMLCGLAFTLGALTLGYKGLPARIGAVEKKVERIEVIAGSIDERLSRIENCLLNGRK